MDTKSKRIKCTNKTLLNHDNYQNNEHSKKEKKIESVKLNKSEYVFCQ
jgi:hypothetical protein